MRVFVVLAVILAFAALWGSQVSATTVRVGPIDSWTPQQKMEYYMGFVSNALEFCGYYSDAGPLEKLARLTPYGRQALREVMNADYYAGTCIREQDFAKKILENKEGWKTLLESKYTCSASGCTERSGQ